MARLDTSIPMQVRAPQLGDLANSYLMSRKLAQDQVAQQQEAALKQKQFGLDVKRDTRAEAGEKREQTVHDEMLADLGKKRQDAQRARINSLLGEEAETLAQLPSEKRNLYYTQYLLPNLAGAGFDTDDMPEYDDGLIHAWRMKALTPGERSDERTAGSKGKYEDLYDMKIDKATGKYVYMPKFPNDPRAPKPILSEIEAPPQIGYGQGADGPRVFVTPRTGEGGTSNPLITPEGTPEGRPLVQIPDHVKATIRSNESAFKVVQDLIGKLEAAAKSHTGPAHHLGAQLPFGEELVNWVDPEGMDIRQDIAKLSSLEMKEMSGAVINAHEFPRLATWLGQTRDSKNVVVSKLKNKLESLLGQHKSMVSQYSKQQGYREDPVLGKEPKAPSAPAKKTVTEADIDKMSAAELKAYLEGK